MSIDRCTEEDVVCVTHNGIYSSHKRNGILSSVMMWMDLESIIQSEESQKEKNKSILTCTYGIQKNGTNEPIFRAGIEKQMQRTDLRAQRRKEKWDKLREQHGHICTTMQDRIYATTGKLSYYRELSSVLCNELDRWGAGTEEDSRGKKYKYKYIYS